MPTPRHRLKPTPRPSWPRRTARLRFTATYSGLFLLSGVALVAVTYLLFQQATQYREPHLPPIPQTPAIQALQLPAGPRPPPVRQLPQALSTLAKDQYQLAIAQQQLTPPDHAQLIQYVDCMRSHGIPGYPYPIGVTTNFDGTGVNPSSPTVIATSALCGHKLNLPAWWIAGTGPLGGSVTVGPNVVGQLTQDQQQLTQDQHQLSQAVNQLAAAVHQVSEAGTTQATQRASDSHELLVNSGIALAITAVLALILGWFAAGRMLRPIRTITATARRISSTNLHERLALAGPEDEFRQLGDTLDDLFARLETSFQAQRHFVANASHELRTPLTAERNLLQVALDDPHTTAREWRDTAHELLASNDEQKHLIEALLALASSESGLDHQQRTDLADICQTVLARPDLDPQHLALHLETVIASAPLHGDPKLLERLVANLVDNAIGHNIAGGHVRITTDAIDGKAVLTTTNTGPLIPDSQIDRLFQPFQRLDPRRTHHKNGHGLGLSIVQAIATTHDATITTQPLPHGGLSITVTFPLAATPSTSLDRVARPRQLAASRPSSPI